MTLRESVGMLLLLWFVVAISVWLGYQLKGETPMEIDAACEVCGQPLDTPVVNVDGAEKKVTLRVKPCSYCLQCEHELGQCDRE